MRLGLDSYSFHRFYRETTAWETLPDTQWSLRDFLNFCDEEKITLASIQTSYMPSDEEVINELARWQQPGREIVFTWGHPNGYNGGKKLSRS